MHFNPGTPIPGGDGKLAAKLKSLQEGALKQISQQYGVPPGWTPQLNSSIYNGVLNDNFQVNLQVEYNKTASGLSEVEGEQLKMPFKI
ncbi:MAG: hypothetical protein HWD61_09255 [Parachlamydiaceae bacterium]|nr:MAG: hypothetical protein HWD61_09255 [Parachlamydiaceae bacterium]